MSLNQIFELIVKITGTFLAIELTASKRECAVNKDD